MKNITGTEPDSTMMLEYHTPQHQNDQNCTLNFICQPNTYATVNVLVFDMHFDSECSKDFLSFDGQKNCGDKIPVYITENQEIDIFFQPYVFKDAATDGFKLQLGCGGL